VNRRVLFVGAAIGAAVLFSGCAKGSPPAAGTAYKDGTYTGAYSNTDDHGWKPRLEITVEKGRITRVAYDEVNASGGLKSADASYEKAMKAAGPTYPAEYIKELDAALIAKQKAGVDAVSGATGSSQSFNALAAALLAKAGTGDTTPVVLPMNTTYTAEDKPDERGWIGSIAVTYTDGRISAVAYDEVKKAAGKVTARKTEDQAYADGWKKATGNTPTDVYGKLAAALVAKQDPAAVDAISGATGTTRRFETLAAAAAAKRQ
jgi:major membrane immunogen (membrane-anchored lipoprotein)